MKKPPPKIKCKSCKDTGIVLRSRARDKYTPRWCVRCGGLGDSVPVKGLGKEKRVDTITYIW